MVEYINGIKLSGGIKSCLSPLCVSFYINLIKRHLDQYENTLSEDEKEYLINLYNSLVQIDYHTQKLQKILEENENKKVE